MSRPEVARQFVRPWQMPCPQAPSGSATGAGGGRTCWRTCVARVSRETQPSPEGSPEYLQAGEAWFQTREGDAYRVQGGLGVLQTTSATRGRCLSCSGRPKAAKPHGRAETMVAGPRAVPMLGENISPPIHRVVFAMLRQISGNGCGATIHKTAPTLAGMGRSAFGAPGNGHLGIASVRTSVPESGARWAARIDSRCVDRVRLPVPDQTHGLITVEYSAYVCGAERALEATVHDRDDTGNSGAERPAPALARLPRRQGSVRLRDVRVGALLTRPAVRRSSDCHQMSISFTW